MKFKPLHDRVLLKRHKPLEKHGALFLPAQAQGKSTICDVVAVGPGRFCDNDRVRIQVVDGPELEHTRVPMHVEVGDVVLVGKYSGDTVMIDDEEHLIVREADILGCYRGVE